jgi:hypothetical protein
LPPPQPVQLGSHHRAPLVSYPPREPQNLIENVQIKRTSLPISQSQIIQNTNLIKNQSTNVNQLVKSTEQLNYIKSPISINPPSNFKAFDRI